MADAHARPVTHARVLRVAYPIVLSNATVPILGAVDTGVVGQLGTAAPIGAVGIGAIVLTAVYWIFGFLRMGTAGLTSQAAGAGDGPEVDVLLSRALLIGASLGVLLVALQIPIFWAAFQISPASEEVESLARAYMSIRIWSAPAAIALYGITGWLVAQERTREVLVLQLWMNGLNILLDLWFVLGLGWGVEGVAFATFLAEWSGAALGLWFCRTVFLRAYWCARARVFDGAKLRRMAAFNRDILLRSVMLEIIAVSFVLLGAGYGDVTLAANQILLQFVHITSYAMDGFTFAAEALVGQAVGAARRDALRRSAVLCLLWGAIAGVALSLLFWVAGGWIIDLMARDPAVQAEARIFLIYMILAPLISCGGWILDGVFIGATRAYDMRNVMAVVLVVYWAVVASLVPTYGNHGLWIAFLTSFALRGILLALRYPALEADADRAR